MDSEVPYSSYQDQIFIDGLEGRKPGLAIAYRKLKEQARAKLSEAAYGYLAGGAGSEDTMRANLQAFRRWRIVPRMLRDVAQRDLSVEVLGKRLPAPLILAPIGVQGIIHSDAELATARAAASLNLLSILSTASSRTLEEVAQATGDAPRWFQLYWPRHPELTSSFLKRAEAAGYEAVVVTLDTRFLGFRERDLQQAYNPFLIGQGIANYFSDPVFRSELQTPPEEDPQTAIRHFAAHFSDPSLTWDDLGSLPDQTRLPILLKGILHPEDARKALDCGVQGLIVSNHGGRQVDGAIAALDALPQVVEAVDDRCLILFDSGIRGGADIFKALALGARAVLIGRPYVWGLAVDGEAGVREVMMRLLADFDLAMALSGYSSLGELSPSALQKL